MIFVNDGSGGYRILGHATWNGLLPGDLLFPCFIWIMGVCIPIAIAGQMKRMLPKHMIFYGIVKVISKRVIKIKREERKK